MYIYLDESGDLGFSKGSTKYFVISFIITKNPNYLKRIARKIKEKHSIPRSVELKGATTRHNIKKDLLTKATKLKDLEAHYIIVKKENIEARLRQDGNIFYNYMVGLSLIPRILKEPKNSTINLVVDRRITSIVSGFSLDKYVKYKILYENNRNDINLLVDYKDSHMVYNLQVVDIICNSIYRKYDNGKEELYNLIKHKVKRSRKLFFK